jgi:hypothetical protein
VPWLHGRQGLSVPLELVSNEAAADAQPHGFSATQIFATLVLKLRKTRFGEVGRRLP